MIDRWFVVNGWLSTALLAAGLSAQGVNPGSRLPTLLLHAGLLLLILTPVTRVVIAGVRYLWAGDRAAAALAAAILAIIAISAWAGIS